MAITLIQPTAVDTPYPQHAKNYLQKEPKLPSPQLDPEDVAKAILKAATKHTRDVKVGVMAKLNVATARHAPGLSDKVAKTRKQEYDEPPRDPEGTLYKPGHSGRTRGVKPKEAQRRH